MSEEMILLKKKKKADYELLRKLEDEYDEAELDLKDKEEILIKSVHREYLKADNKGEFFEELHYGQDWYYERFKKYELSTEFPLKSDALRNRHAEHKVDELLEDFEDQPRYEGMVEEIRETPAVDIVKSVDFGKYQETLGKIKRIKLISSNDFNVGITFKLKLVSELKEARKYIDSLLKKVEVKEHERP
jgi:hypothetical protein